MDHSIVSPLASALIFASIGFWTAMFCYFVYRQFVKWSKNRYK